MTWHAIHRVNECYILRHMVICSITIVPLQKRKYLFEDLINLFSSGLVGEWKQSCEGRRAFTPRYARYNSSKQVETRFKLVEGEIYTPSVTCLSSLLSLVLMTKLIHAYNYITNQVNTIKWMLGSIVAVCTSLCLWCLVFSF